LSWYQENYAQTLVKNDLVKAVSITNALKTFKVINTNGDEYEVMVNEKGYNCTCVFGSLWSGGSKDCCHIIAVKIMEGNYNAD